MCADRFFIGCLAGKLKAMKQGTHHVGVALRTDKARFV
jgi:hypothetical protein